MAIFLAEAAAALDDDRLRATAIGAIRHATTHAERVRTDGLHEGRLGIAYAAARVAARTGSEAARDGRPRRAARLAARAAVGAPDVSDGAAGDRARARGARGPLDEPGCSSGGGSSATS